MKRILSISAVLLMVMVGFAAEHAANAVTDDAAVAPKYTIEEVMKKAHHRTTGLLRIVLSGTATGAQKAELLELYEALAENKPSKGDQADWAKRTALLVDAARAAVDGNTGAGEMLSRASSCKSCHSAHK